jgi:hypothetical protein
MIHAKQLYGSVVLRIAVGDELGDSVIERRQYIQPVFGERITRRPTLAGRIDYGDRKRPPDGGNGRERRDDLDYAY